MALQGSRLHARRLRHLGAVLLRHIVDVVRKIALALLVDPFIELGAGVDCRTYGNHKGEEDRDTTRSDWHHRATPQDSLLGPPVRRNRPDAYRESHAKGRPS